MSGLIDFYEELRLKMQAGVDNGAIELGHSKVYVGTREMTGKNNDYPMLIIIPRFGEGVPECTNFGQVEEIETEILYTVPKQAQDYNVLYKADKTGALRNLEQIINYLHYNRTTENFNDTVMNNTSYDSIRYSYRIGYDADGMLVLQVTIKNKIAKYTRGQI